MTDELKEQAAAPAAALAAQEVAAVKMKPPERGVVVEISHGDGREVFHFEAAGCRLSLVGVISPKPGEVFIQTTGGSLHGVFSAAYAAAVLGARHAAEILRQTLPNNAGGHYQDVEGKHYGSPFLPFNERDEVFNGVWVRDEALTLKRSLYKDGAVVDESEYPGIVALAVSLFTETPIEDAEWHYPPRWEFVLMGRSAAHAVWALEDMCLPVNDPAAQARDILQGLISKPVLAAPGGGFIPPVRH